MKPYANDWAWDFFKKNLNARTQLARSKRAGIDLDDARQEAHLAILRGRKPEDGIGDHRKKEDRERNRLRNPLMFDSCGYRIKPTGEDDEDNPRNYEESRSPCDTFERRLCPKQTNRDDDDSWTRYCESVDGDDSYDDRPGAPQPCSPKTNVHHFAYSAIDESLEIQAVLSDLSDDEQQVAKGLMDGQNLAGIERETGFNQWKIRTCMNMIRLSLESAGLGLHGCAGSYRTPPKERCG